MQQITQNEATTALRRIAFVLELPADRNEVQTIDLGDIATGDTYTLTFGSEETGGITFASDMSSAIKTALEALTFVGTDDLTVTKVSGQQDYIVTFGGSLAATDVGLLSITDAVGFTPGTVTETLHGGVAGAPARSVVLDPSEIRVSKNGASNVESAGSVTEVGHGLYYYAATSDEVDTLGFLALTVLRDDVAMTYGVAQVIAAASSLGAPVIRSGTAQAGGASTLTLDASASGTTDFYKHALAFLRSGTGAGQARLVASYNGTTKVATIEPAWAAIPDSTTVFDLLPVEPTFADLLRVNHAVSGTFGGDLVDAADIATPIGEIADKAELLSFTDNKVHATLPPTSANPT